MKRLLLAVSVSLAAACGGPGTGGQLKQECKCEDGCLEACEGGPTHYKTVSREPAAQSRGALEETGAPFEEADPPSPFEPLEGDALQEAQKLLSTDAVFIVNDDFASRRGDEYLIVSDDGIAIHKQDGTKVARAEITWSDEDPEPRVVRMIDERAEIVAYRRDAGQIYVTTYRVIGDAIAKVFDHPIRTVDGEVLADFAFVRRGDEWAFRLTGPEGENVYRWNHWEGVFRIPTPAPTAPR